MVKAKAHKDVTTKARIFQAFSDGWSYKQLREKFEVGDATIARIVKRFQEAQTFERRQGSGRPKKTTPRADRLIANCVKKDPFITKNQIKEEVELAISTKTIGRRIYELLGYKSYWAARKPLLTPRQVKRRLAWCMEHKSWTVDQWRKVIWTDESPFVLRFHGRCRVWRGHNERYLARNIRSTIKHDTKINVWGAFAFDLARR
jgi:transposase